MSGLFHWWVCQLIEANPCQLGHQVTQKYKNEPVSIDTIKSYNYYKSDNFYVKMPIKTDTSMKTSNFTSKLVKLALLACLGLSLSGCDPLRSRLADWISPQTPQEALKSIETMVAAGQLKEALAKAEAFIDKPGDFRPQFELAAARVSALQGQADLALRHLSLALAELNIPADKLMTDEAFTTLRTNVRFLQIITGGARVQPSLSAGTEVKASENTQIKITNQGTEVRAGDVVIKLPN
jgi:hypothetical protein